MTAQKEHKAQFTGPEFEPLFYLICPKTKCGPKPRRKPDISGSFLVYKFSSGPNEPAIWRFQCRNCGEVTRLEDL